MKKILSIAFLLISIAGYSQNIPLSGFDTTTGRPGYKYTLRPLNTIAPIIAANDSSIGINPSVFDSLKHKYIDTGAVMRNSFVLAYDSLNKKWIMSAGGTGGSGGISTLSPIGATPNANGATITGSALNLEAASASYGGIITTGTQTITGSKSIITNTAGVTGLTLQNTNTGASSISRFGILNNAGDGLYLNSYGNGVSGPLNLRYDVASTKGLLISSDIAVSTGGTNKIQFTLGGYGNTPQITFDAIGRIGVGSSIISPTALLHFKAGTSTAGTAPVKFTAGAGLATIESGAMETDFFNDLFYTNTVSRSLVAMWNYVAKTATYTIANGDRTVDCTSGTFTVTLPTAASYSLRHFTIKNSGTGVITIATTSSQTIDGATTYSLPTQYKYVTVQCTGSNWIVIGNN